MRKITEIYKEYKIMPSLAMHQLRVTSVAQMICENINIEVDKDTLIKTALLHDMGNVIKFDLTQTKEIFGFSDSEISEIAQIKEEFIQKYGNNEHDATVKIIKELGMPDEIANLADKNRFSNLCIDKDGDNMLLKILHYSDGRVGTHGVLSFDERMSDAGKRYKNHKLKIEEETHDKLVDCGREIEKQIFAHSNIKPEDINDESVKEIIENLKNFEI